MPLTPEQRQELERLKALFKPASEEALRRKRAVENLEQTVGTLKLPTDKKASGGSARDKNLRRFLKDSGVQQPMYHSTTRDFSVFDRMASATRRPVSMDTVGSWFSSNPDKAAQYAGGEGHNVMPVYLNIKNPKLYSKFDDFLRDMHEAEGRKLEEQNPRGIGSTEGLRKKLMAQGYDGIQFEQTDNARLYKDIEAMQQAIKQAKQDEFSVKRIDRAPYTMKRERLENTLRSMADELKKMGGSTEFDGHDVYVAFHPTQIKSAIGNRGTYDPTNPDITKADGGNVQSDAVLRSDIPNEDWLRDNVDYAKQKGRDRYGVPYMGKVTGTFNRNLKLPVSLLASLKGMRGEQQNVRQSDLAWLKNHMQKTGKLPLTESGEEYAPFVMVNHSGEPWVSEGNHRIMAAKQLGMSHLPVEVRYFDGGERAEGKFHPDRLKAHDANHSVPHKASGGSIPSLDVMRLAIGGQGPRNWLKGSVEKLIDPMKLKTAGGMEPAEALRQMREKYPPDTTHPDTMRRVTPALNEVERMTAMNQWVERNLANYIRKQMASPNDPIRKLAEQGILHMDPELLEDQGKWGDERRQIMGGEKLGKSQHAQAWEDATDSAFEPNTVDDIINMPDIYKGLQEPWMEKADPKTNVFELYGAHELGFDHIVDVLKDDLASGRIRPEQLSKVSIADAVRRVYEVDQANKKAQQQASLQATEGMPVHKDYGDGFKWIEIAPKKPDVNEPLPEGYQWLEPKNGLERLQGPSILAPDRGRVYLGDTKQEALEIAHKKDHNLSDRREKPVKDALAYESDVMGHCVGGQKLPDGTRTGGYTDDVMRGDTRIFSLRDEKNEPHVTIEVKPNDHLDFNDWYAKQPTSFKALINAKKSEPGFNIYEMPEYLAARKAVPPKIKQIKGKQNAKPKKDYIPYVQDFVKSGKWSAVGDLNNTDLVKHEGQYMTKDEQADALLKALKPDGMAHGGEVDAETVFMAGGGFINPESCFFPNTKE